MIVSKKKILVIEDNPDMRDNISEILELADYEVSSAENGKRGVEKATEIIPDLIVCDIMMPELNGYGVLRLLSKKESTARIPFIFLTAKTDKDDFRKGMNLGADDYITKPFDEADLLDAIESRIKRSELMRKEYDVSNSGLTSFFNEAKGKTALLELTKNKEVRHFKKKEMIYLQENYPHAVYFIQKGKVKLFKTNEDGKEFIVSIKDENNFLGYLALFQNVKYPESAVAMEDVTVSVISKDDFFELILNNRDVALKFIQILSKVIIRKDESLIALAYNTVRKRVADGLLEIANHYNYSDATGFPVFREDLANLVGTASESVIRVLSEFKEQNLISTDGRTIRILDKEGLGKVRY